MISRNICIVQFIKHVEIVNSIRMTAMNDATGKRQRMREVDRFAWRAGAS